MTLATNDTDVAELLAEPHVGVLALTPPGAGAPLVTPVWYAPTPGGAIVVATARSSVTLRMLRAGAPATFLVHRDLPPSHASAAVQVHVADADAATRRLIATRYVPSERLDAFVSATPDADVAILDLRPGGWRFVDLTRAPASTAS